MPKTVSVSLNVIILYACLIALNCRMHHVTYSNVVCVCDILAKEFILLKTEIGTRMGEVYQKGLTE